MTGRSIDFDDEYLWGSAGTYNSQRPYSEVFVWHKKKVFRIFCLVDSGADRLQLDEAIAHFLGISLSNATTIGVKLANGTFASYSLVPSVVLQIEGQRIQADTLFAHNIPSLLGRTAFLKAITVAIDSSGWLYKT